MKSILVSFILVLFLNANGQVAVRDEPNHHNVFENDYARLLDVHLKPGDTTLYHLHNTPSVFIFFSKTKTNWQLMGKEAEKAPAFSNPGSVVYEDLSKAPRIHRVMNVDSNWYHVMDVELLSTGSGNNARPLTGPPVKIIFDEKEARGYEIGINKGSVFEIDQTESPYLFISLSTTSIKYMLDKKEYQRRMLPSHFLFVDKGSRISIRGDDEAKFVVLEMK